VRRGGDRRPRRFDNPEWEKRAAVIRERVPIRAVIEPHVALEKAGSALQGVCPMPDHLEKTGSFTVYPNGGLKVKVPFFVCYGCGAKGDVIHFVMRHKGLEWVDAIKVLEAENGLALLSAEAAPRKPQAPQAQMDTGKLERARELVGRSLELGAGGIVDQYLRARAIVPPSDYGVTDAGVNAGWPVDLRFVERCWHDLERREFPAMIATIRDVHTGALLTVHRTYLARKDGVWTKAPVAKSKLVVGPWPPGVVLLGPPAAKMTGGEGIETSLSAMQLSKRSGLCFVNSSRMKSAPLPDCCLDFLYAADKGGKNGTSWGEKFAKDAAAEQARLRKVTVAIPRIEAAKGDFNDVVKIRAGLLEDKAPAAPVIATIAPAPERLERLDTTPGEVRREAMEYELKTSALELRRLERAAWQEYSRAAAELEAAKAVKVERVRQELVGAAAEKARAAKAKWDAAAASYDAARARRIA
jgi:hypothetical protein